MERKRTIPANRGTTILIEGKRQEVSQIMKGERNRGKKWDLK